VEAFDSQPLLTKRGRGKAPTMRGSDSKSVQLLDRDSSHSDAQSGAATGWRCVVRQTDSAVRVPACLGRCAPAQWNARGQSARLPQAPRRAERTGAAADSRTTGGSRPFAWRGAVHLAHRVRLAPGEERMAISSIDEAGTSVHLEHVLSPLPALEAAAEVLRHATGQAGEQAAPLPTEAGPAHARGGGWGLFEDRGRLLMYQAFLPCTVAVQIILEDADGPRSGSSARVVGGACVADAAASIAAATGARLPSACCRRTHGDVQRVSSAYGRTWEAP